jgi:protein-arginine kinase activator protein McsA
MLCQNCHEREATCHVAAFADGISQSRDLCNECFEAEFPENMEVRTARCQYCDGQPCAGGTDFLALVTGVQETKYMCMPCSIEHNRYVQQKSQQEQLAMLRTLNIEADEHMKQWVSERHSQ